MKCDICGRKETIIQKLKSLLTLDVKYIRISGITFCSYDCYYKYTHSLTDEEWKSFFISDLKNR